MGTSEEQAYMNEAEVLLKQAIAGNNSFVFKRSMGLRPILNDYEIDTIEVSRISSNEQGALILGSPVLTTFISNGPVINFLRRECSSGGSYRSGIERLKQYINRFDQI